jgi:hypothetical protein
MLPHPPSSLTLFRSAVLGLQALAANSPPGSGVSHFERIDVEPEMVQLTEEARLRLAALAYVIELHNELTQENGSPPLGTQIRPSISSWATRNCGGSLPTGRPTPTSMK